ncbi:MAG TPA: hypothetical protein VII86_03565, partial [Thermoanaerobaculia bacterium]
MSKSREEELFRQAVEAFQAGELDTAYQYFRQIVEINGDRKKEAEQYLIEIDRRRSMLQTGGYGAARETKEYRDQDVDPGDCCTVPPPDEGPPEPPPRDEIKAPLPATFSPGGLLGRPASISHAVPPSM